MSKNAHKLHCHLLVPYPWNLVIIRLTCNKSQLFYLFSSFYKFKFYIPIYTSDMEYNQTLGVFYFTPLVFSRFVSIFIANLKYLLSIFSFPAFNKLKFRGKGYYIYKNVRNTIAPQFGYAHRIYIYSSFLSVKFLSKVKVFIFGFLKSDVLKTSFLLKSKRPINIFTGRGVRFSRQIIYKKTGKVSAYR